MAEYLNYGDQLVELLALLNNLANSVLGYVAKQPWSNKRKEKFMNAYSDLLNRGLQGASNSSGLWMLNVGGTPIPWDSMDRKDKEMYLEAAYFIQQLMAALPTKNPEKEELKSEEELTPFDSFQKNFINFTSKRHYGGNDISTSEWNELDERGENGLRGTKVRANRLAQYLKEYSESLEDKKYDFKDSPFTDLQDLKTRIGNAVIALQDENFDLNDKDALNAIGLKASDWFNNGSGDPSDMVDANGNRLTWAQKAQLIQTSTELNLKQDKELERNNVLKALQNISKFKSLYGYLAPKKEEFKWKTKHFFDRNIHNLNELYNYVKENYSNFKSNDEFSKHSLKILGAYVLLNDNNKLSVIDDNLWKNLKEFKSINNRDKKDFKFIKGIDNIVLDTRNNKIYFLGKDKLKTKNENDPFKKYKLKKERLLYDLYYSKPFYTPLRKNGGKITDSQIDNFLRRYK